MNQVQGLEIVRSGCSYIKQKRREENWSACGFFCFFYHQQPTYWASHIYMFLRNISFGFSKKGRRGCACVIHFWRTFTHVKIYQFIFIFLSTNNSSIIIQASCTVIAADCIIRTLYSDIFFPIVFDYFLFCMLLLRIDNIHFVHLL